MSLALHAVAHAQDPSGRSAPATAQRAALAARIDSLLAERDRYSRLLAERNRTRAAVAETLHPDTTVIGPFLFVNREAPPAASVAALRNVWEAHAATVGEAVTRLNGVVISMDLSATDLAAGVSKPSVHHYRVRRRGAPSEYDDAAAYVIAAALVSAMPQDLQDWIGGGSLHTPDAFVRAYRDLATSASVPARRCYARDVQACVVSIAGDSAQLVSPATRISLLQHALEIGGRDAYARLISAAPTIAGQLTQAAEQPLPQLMTGWRDAVQEARPRVRAGVARAGMWTLLWLVGLALLSMRSTRWRPV
jgi:hypothetical protein